MSHAYLSASGGDRAAACPAAYALPADPRTETDDGSRGTAIHAYLESLQTMPHADALRACADSVRATCESILLAEVPRGAAEVAYVWDAATDTAACLGKIEHRGYAAALGRPLKPTEIPCTIDLVYGDTETGSRVLDWKTGYENIPDPRTSMQLGLAAICLARAGGLEAVTVVVARVGMDGQIYMDDHDYDSFGLEDMADRWRTVWARVEATRAALAEGDAIATSPGPHCRYCPATGSCPQFAGIARELLSPGSDWLARARTLIRDDGEAAALWVKVSRARELLGTLQGLLEARAVERPFRLPDGREVREVECKRDAVKSARTVADVLLELYGADVSSDAVETELHTTKGAIEKAVGKHAKAVGTKAAPEVRRALTVLRERGAVEERRYTNVEAVEPRKGAA